MNIRIVTDSTSDIMPQEAQLMNIDVVPLKTIFGTQEYRDGIDITPDDFYRLLENAKVFPTTSQPTPHAFEKVFSKAKARGESILCILIAGALSGTMQSAKIARDLTGADVTIIDSGTATTPLRALVMQAVSMRDAGHNMDEIISAIEGLKTRVRIYAAINTLEYLKKGGRLSRTAAFAGELLQLKPLVTLKNGHVSVVDKIRGRAKSLKAVLDIMTGEEAPDPSLPLYLGYTGDRSDFSAFEQLANAKYGSAVSGICPIGAVIGAHIGPAGAAVAYFTKA